VFKALHIPKPSFSLGEPLVVVTCRITASHAPRSMPSPQINSPRPRKKCHPPIAFRE
jgi:hypothetical protein